MMPLVFQAVIIIFYSFIICGCESMCGACVWGNCSEKSNTRILEISQTAWSISNVYLILFMCGVTYGYINAHFF